MKILGLGALIFIVFYISQCNAYTAFYAPNHKVWSASMIHDPSKNFCEIFSLEQKTHRWSSVNNLTYVKARPARVEIDPVDDGHLFAGESHSHNHRHYSKESLITIYSPTRAELMNEISFRCKDFTVLTKSTPRDNLADTVTKIVYSGDPSNRIDVVLMGDGYTSADEQAMDSDMRRLTADMFQGVTFSDYLPVFNIWSIYRVSAQRGIGSGGSPRNTAFGLYRDGTELRGVYCSKPTQAREACTQTGPDACDFPSLIGNDPYYGGLGGEFTISTQSPTSGTIVLRHEMGHNFIYVGEEYDGGSAYFGVNHSPSRNGINVPWQSWLTEPVDMQIEGSIIKVQEYAWYNLANGPFTTTFTSDGTYGRWGMRYSISGCESPNSIRITLDGQEIPFTARGLDRFIVDVSSDVPLSSGSHTLTFRQLTSPPPGNPIRQLCSVTLHEYKSEPEFHMDDVNYIGAYPTWRQGKSLVGYRPTNERCLMRNMTSTIFCPVCYEGMWMEFFRIISAIDNVTLACTGGAQVSVSLNTVKLGQLREGGAKPGERLEVKWFYSGNHLSQFDDHFSLSINSQNYVGQWRVDVQYITPLVRYDPQELLHFSQNFQVSAC